MFFWRYFLLFFAYEYFIFIRRKRIHVWNLKIYFKIKSTKQTFQMKFCADYTGINWRLFKRTFRFVTLYLSIYEISINQCLVRKKHFCRLFMLCKTYKFSIKTGLAIFFFFFTISNLEYRPRLQFVWNVHRYIAINVGNSVCYTPFRNVYCLCNCEWKSNFMCSGFRK